MARDLPPLTRTRGLGSREVLLLELLGAEVADGRVPAASIVEDGNVLEDGVSVRPPELTKKNHPSPAFSYE